MLCQADFFHNRFIIFLLTVHDFWNIDRFITIHKINVLTNYLHCSKMLKKFETNKNAGRNKILRIFKFFAIPVHFGTWLWFWHIGFRSFMFVSVGVQYKQTLCWQPLCSWLHQRYLSKIVKNFEIVFKYTMLLINKNNKKLRINFCQC